MNTKIVLASISLSAFLLVNPLIAFAQSTSPVPTGGNKAANLAKLNTNCTNAINQRLTSLNSALTRINGLQKLATNYKTQYSGEVNTDISGLQALQTQCTTDFNSGNIQALRKDYQNIFLQFRVYAVFLPQLWNLIASDTMSVTASKLADLANKLQTRVQQAGNPSNLTNLLSDMQAKVSDANTQYNNVESQVTPLTPSSYNTDPNGTTSILKNARSEIKTGASDLQTAWSDAKQIVQILKSMKTKNPSPVVTQ